MAKVGKSFGFSVPPRVNVNIGGGKGGAGRTGKKRRRDEDAEENDEEWEEIDAVDKEGSDNEGTLVGDNVAPRRIGKDRRRETLGRKKVEKEVYRRGTERKRMKGGPQWSR